MKLNSIGWNLLRDYSAAFSLVLMPSRLGNAILGNLYLVIRIISGESGAVTTGLLSILMQSPVYQSAKEELGLDENAKECFVISTEGDTDPERYRDIVGWRAA